MLEIFKCLLLPQAKQLFKRYGGLNILLIHLNKVTVLYEVKFNVSFLVTYDLYFVCLTCLFLLVLWFILQIHLSEKKKKKLLKVFLSFLGGSDGQESASNVGDLVLIPGLGRSPRGGHGNPLQYSCLEIPHGQRSLVSYIHGVEKSWTQLSN